MINRLKRKAAKKIAKTLRKIVLLNCQGLRAIDANLNNLNLLLLTFIESILHKTK
ncbi:MAG: hypothetical protein AVDCRST_MAG74-3581 [uncultured Pyrinomonadaceae bacterium]|uniref:Uncharacterized protein n=1 Tax=uncultured Pyrinomonadaceae bacterium TaxID=2283094 RepID=A0A6J4PYF3_9BACT|nr:MAG: hypothetical protein AVDCRST_MAG74-3581 [uncultured Pyrinomonadaceae bacterium]